MGGLGLASVLDDVFSPEQIIKAIQDYMDRCRAPYWHWYVGITSDPSARLFQEHDVAKEGYGWIYYRALTHRDARAVEAFFVDNFGTDGGVGGGDSQSIYVYAYLKDRYTNP